MELATPGERSGRIIAKVVDRFFVRFQR